MSLAGRQIASRLRSTVGSLGRPHWQSIRSASAAAAKHKSASIGDVLSSASTTRPLKDAVKFLGAPSEKVTVWTYSELNKHVNALASGLQELGYASGDKILTLLPAEGPEYAVTLLAASKLGVSIVACDPPTDPMNVSVSAIEEALKKHGPKAFIIGKEYQVSALEQDDEGAIAAVNPIVNAFAPEVALAESKGIAGFSPLSGKSFDSAEHPYLEHVVQTSDTNMRGTITFKSLLVYSGHSPELGSGKEPLLVNAKTGAGASASEILTAAGSLGSKLGLSADHGAKSGKVVITPSVSATSAAAMVSAVMHESLWVSPGLEAASEVSSSENALVA